MIKLVEDIDELRVKMANTIIYSNLMVIDCYTDFCKPCKKLEPIYEEIAKEMEDVSFYKANMSDSDDIVDFFDIRKLPTIKIIKGGDVVDTFTGLKDKDYIVDMINKYKKN